MSYSYKIPKFRPDQSPRDWLNAFNTGCKILKVKDEEKLDYVPGYLNKSVSRWFYDHDFESYQQFEKEFEDRFTVLLLTAKQK
ncbi:hypothetical protein G6F37_012701 [Rhizopus arrhizus]|nr:hypothetical protein G6F38_012751 [Rhizopus arrhizus]KAG1142090.1 hypothetical protein G6F37_012701 [Rhizopus arrhizus]